MNHGISPPSVSPPAPPGPPGPGVTENVRNSEDCIWVTIMLLNSRLATETNQSCSLQWWPSSSSNFKRLIFNNGILRYQETKYSEISMTFWESANDLKNIEEINHSPLNFIHTALQFVDVVVNMCSRAAGVQLWFIFWHYRLFSSPDPLFYSHYSSEHLLDLIQRERERDLNFKSRHVLIIALNPFIVHWDYQTAGWCYKSTWCKSIKNVSSTFCLIFHAKTYTMPINWQN